MDRRLIPLNGVLALLSTGAGTSWPNDLAQQALRLHLLEGDVQSTPQTVRADVIAYRVEPALIVLFECKSGRNISPAQARGYCNATFDGLRRRTSIPGPLRDWSNVPLVSVFVGLDAQADALVESMAREQISAPVLLLGQTGAELRGSSTPGLIDFVNRSERYGMPPGRVLIDQDSSIDEIREIVIQQVGVALSRGDQVVELAQVAGAAHPYWASVARPAQLALMERLKAAARSLASGEMREDLAYESSNVISPRLVLLAEPRKADPRGAPQAWQALKRRASRSVGRTERPQIEGQLRLSFDELDPEPEGDDDDVG
jgi:hypothetical protein